jgi:hypothetical protein
MYESEYEYVNSILHDLTDGLKCVLIRRIFSYEMFPRIFSEIDVMRSS